MKMKILLWFARQKNKALRVQLWWAREKALSAARRAWELREESRTWEMTRRRREAREQMLRGMVR